EPLAAGAGVGVVPVSGPLVFGKLMNGTWPGGVCAEVAMIHGGSTASAAAIKGPDARRRRCIRKGIIKVAYARTVPCPQSIVTIGTALRLSPGETKIVVNVVRAVRARGAEGSDFAGRSDGQKKRE